MNAAGQPAWMSSAELAVFAIALGVSAVIATAGPRRRASRAFFAWLRKTLDLPTPEDRSRLLWAWDIQQANDWKIVSADPDYAQVKEAARRLDSAPEAAFGALLEFAERGSVWGMVQVAYCYHAGRGVAADMTRAEDWYRRAAEGGSQHAALSYGRILWHRGELDRCEAVFGAAAADDWAPAQYWLARTLVRKSRKRATLRRVRPLLESAVAKGSPAAKWFLAYYLVRGWLGLREIPAGFRMAWQFATETRPILEAIGAAEGGSAAAQYRLGWIYAFGGNLAHDDGKAMRLFDLAIAQGDANAMLAKGWLYAHGQGVEYDPFEAYVWSALAAIRLPETDAESRAMAVQYRDFYRPHLNKADAARARRFVKKRSPPQSPPIS